MVGHQLLLLLFQCRKVPKILSLWSYIVTISGNKFSREDTALMSERSVLPLSTEDNNSPYYIQQ